jgi:hypothetical protein
MGYATTMVGYPAPPVRAAQDLRTHQYKAVRIQGDGVRLAAATVNQTSGAIYVLQNKPNSGEDCTLLGPPNITKAVAGGAIALGNWVTMNTSATFAAHTVPGSYMTSITPVVGVCWEVAAADGDEFALHLK